MSVQGAASYVLDGVVLVFTLWMTIYPTVWVFDTVARVLFRKGSK